MSRFQQFRVCFKPRMDRNQHSSALHWMLGRCKYKFQILRITMFFLWGQTGISQVTIWREKMGLVVSMVVGQSLCRL